ncbi:Phophatidylserine decarboxylase-domain-containing protein [Lophiotrema nucula]|uniref:Phophatidylserine decarboxylase-domain-containing protein n=1 Tax=Lophiotrema nucula TaxID=690887 RepID=A0A6A5YM64_9PLEO|nr:Phophatidylserine decarboxylase-domain-containing protein [Lophiotrema nucula]
MSNQSAKDGDLPKDAHMHRVGGWLPSDHRAHKDWLSGKIEQAENDPRPLHPVIQEFQDLIESNTRIFMLFSSMFQEIPSKKPYANDPTGHKQIHDYPHMLQLFNHLLTEAPSWNDKSHRVGMVGLPINAVLDWPMGTPSGWAAFLDPDVNKIIKKMLNAWGEFLSSPDSRAGLDNSSSGWFSETGVSDLASVANLGKSSHKFEDLFHCDPSQPYHGFKSWDDFFTRHFKEGIRPVASPDNDDVIANACESTTYNYTYDVKFRDQFWVKGQPYSVFDMLGQDELAEQFTGGTIYQAFLSALSYHRWHAPVRGTVKKTYVIDGTYYSEPLFEGIGDPNNETREIDMGGETTGQGYITHTATRAVIFIEADNPKIGLMAFMGVGMSEVSTCDITVKEGQHIDKGDEIGMFHFGGSTHCLMFRKGVNVKGFPEPGGVYNVPVRSQVANVE